MTMDEIRAEMDALAEQLGQMRVRLRNLAEATKRRVPTKRAPRKSTPMTPRLKREIRQCVKDNPNASQVEIARLFNVNPGRVSEAVRGYRR